MGDQKTGAFEQKVAELESIVKQLEQGNVELDRAVELFKRGKTLASECEELLKGAQAQIDRAMEQTPQTRATTDTDEIPF